jgi:hypothetical protein
VVQHYTKRKWSGLDNYKCSEPECVYDSFVESDLKLHWEAVHGPNPTIRPPEVHRSKSDD